MAYSHTISKERQRDIMNSFAYMGYQGKFDMNNPEFIMACIEEYPDSHGWPRHKRQVDGEFLQAIFGRLIVEGTARKLIAVFDVKKRSYYGNTSMEAEISLLMANQTLAAQGKLIYDPFVGTGSMLYTAAHFGALVFGSDIDGRQMRGKGRSKFLSHKFFLTGSIPIDMTPGIRKAAAQYGVLSRVLDLCTFDVTQGPLRRGGLFDAIVTDPPYGVRAGAKRLGRKDGQEMRAEPLVLQDGTLSHTHKTYVPPTKPYELSALATDLVELARYLLVPGGRLVFFLPTVTDDYAPVDVPQCEGMRLVANSLQNFGKWGRRLITMEKVTKEEYPAPTFGLEERANGHTPAHKNFRDKYFKGFRKEDDVDINMDDVVTTE
ncbi:unnamed protein product [Rhizoctonia solani]|uniref:Uncharacterized protein n=1 Tax=Rhizoctonia solani TaxID=456999 RepID=A0A8H3E9A7_9AGAM|nr:unnamed protein product [Rhizoctonia solani]